MQIMNRGLSKAFVDELKTIWKDEGVIIFFILVPLLYPLLYSWIYTNEVVREVPVAVVDLSHSDMSRDFIRKFDSSPDTRIACYCNNLDEAKDAIGRQDAFGVIYFPTDFQTNIMRMEQSRVSVFCDMSFMLYYKAIFQTATAVAGDVNSKIQIERAGNWTNREDEITTKPLDYEEVQSFNTTGGYGNFIIPGVLMLIIQQTLLLGIGLIGGTRRERMSRMPGINALHTTTALPEGNAATAGTDNNTSLQPAASTITDIIGRALCYFMIYTIMGAYIILAVPQMFGFTSLLKPVTTLCFMLPYLLACIFFSMTVACFIRYRENVILLVVFTSVPLLFISGVSWPQSAIPDFWQWFSYLFPSTFGIRGFVRMNTMGALLADIKPEYITLWIQAVVYFTTTCILYRRRAKA